MRPNGSDAISGALSTVFRCSRSLGGAFHSKRGGRRGMIRAAQPLLLLCSGGGGGGGSYSRDAGFSGNPL
jgi:hypothetical protein